MSNKPRKMTLEKKHNLTGWAFLAPATFLIAVFSFWPMIKALVLSFQTGKGRNMQMAGFTNYIRMFQDDVFIQSIKNTFFYFILQVPIMLVVAMVLACILNKKDLCFKYVPNFGYAAAMSFFILLLVAVLALIQMRVGDKRD